LPKPDNTASNTSPEAKPAPQDATMPKADTASKQAAAQSSPTPAAKPVKAKPERKSDKLVHAKELFSPKAIFDPRVMQATGTLSRNSRIGQLCRIEALAQIRSQRPDTYPDGLASAGTISNNIFSARGGAFHSKANWYDVNFRCQVDADATRVVSFSFSIGNAVPRSEWDARKLPAN
jgi:hypothetical protein